MARGFITVILLASGVFVAALPVSSPISSGTLTRPSYSETIVPHSHSSHEVPTGSFSVPPPSFTGSFTGLPSHSGLPSFSGLPPSGTASHEIPTLSVTKRQATASRPPTPPSGSFTGTPPSFTGSFTGHPSHSEPAHSGSFTGTPPSFTGSFTGEPLSHTRLPPSSVASVAGREVSSSAPPPPPTFTGSFTGHPSHSEPAHSGSFTGTPPSFTGSATGHPSYSGTPPSGTPPPSPTGTRTASPLSVAERQVSTLSRLSSVSVVKPSPPVSSATKPAPPPHSSVSSKPVVSASPAPSASHHHSSHPAPTLPSTLLSLTATHVKPTVSPTATA